MQTIVRLALAAALVAVAGCAGAGASPTRPASQTSPTAAPPASGSPAGSPAGAACAASTEAGAVQVTIRDFAFNPATVQAAVGDVVAWTNEDSTEHSAVIDAGCATDTLATGATGALVFNQPGTYPYVCGIHPSMRGTVEVTP